MNKKNCKGTLYRISGKSYCIGEKKSKGKSIKLRKSRKAMKSKKSRKSRKSRKNKARGPGDENDDYYDITQCCMCGKDVNVNDKTNTLIPLECLQKRGRRAHRICKKCWFKPKTGFAIEGTSHKCPGCEKGKPLTNVRHKTPEMVDLTDLSD
jgi:hypothetical protein